MVHLIFFFRGMIGEKFIKNLFPMENGMGVPQKIKNRINTIQ